MHPDQRHEELAAKYQYSFMSDTKWRRAFTAIAGSGVKIERAIWRFIDGEAPWETGLPSVEELDERRLRDGRFQPVEYRWIESIFIPRTFRRRKEIVLDIEQPVDAVIDALRREGDFFLQIRDEGVTVVGYSGLEARG